MRPDKDNLSMRPQWYLLRLDRDLKVLLSLPPSQELACGVGCPEAPGRPGRGRCMAREKIQGSIIKTKPLVFDCFCYMPPFLLWTTERLHLITAACRKQCKVTMHQRSNGWKCYSILFHLKFYFQF